MLANPGQQTSAAGATVSLQLQATSPDGDRLAYSAYGLPSGLAVGPSGNVSGQLAATAASSYVQVTATDTVTNLSSSQTFDWTVTPSITPSYPPYAGNQSYTVYAGALSVPASGVLGAVYSPSGLPATVALVSPAMHGSVMLGQDGSFSYTAYAGFAGTDSFHLRRHGGRPDLQRRHRDADRGPPRRRRRRRWPATTPTRSPRPPTTR